VNQFVILVYTPAKSEQLLLSEKIRMKSPRNTPLKRHGVFEFNFAASVKAGPTSASRVNNPDSLATGRFGQLNRASSRDFWPAGTRLIWMLVLPRLSRQRFAMS
jgi:hypothetical protein